MIKVNYNIVVALKYLLFRIVLCSTDYFWFQKNKMVLNKNKNQSPQTNWWRLSDFAHFFYSFERDGIKGCVVSGGGLACSSHAKKYKK